MSYVGNVVIGFTFSFVLLIVVRMLSAGLLRFDPGMNPFVFGAVWLFVTLPLMGRFGLRFKTPKDTPTQTTLGDRGEDQGPPSVPTNPDQRA